MIILIKLIDLYSLLIVVRAVISWISTPTNSTIYYYIYKLTEPMLAKLRFISLRLNLPFDISPIIVLLALNYIKKFLITYHV